MSASVSGLSAKHRAQARHTVLAGVRLLMHDPSIVHYTQGPARWEGINRHYLISKGQFPKHGDCSSTGTWLLWNALYVPFSVRDVVNGAAWGSGYTGTMARHGKRVVHDANIKVGDLILYGDAPTFEHVTVALGGGRCFSHGSERGPYILDIDYRPDRAQVRRYI